MEAAGQRIMNLLGMAQKAGRIVSGNFAVEQAIKGGKAKYLIVAADAAEESRKDYQELANRYGIPFSLCLTKELLGKCLGKEYRAAAALQDEGFSKALAKLIGEGKY
ncbi:MAG: ribosomal L7Ae/L30e/S12e/Gadd45 family protein [Selenomonadaceae bacterium]|nr:ribosomal L7Ae/L30e/S12e/Gadd45 family protein [Selenomonadaceae bacterium]